MSREAFGKGEAGGGGPRVKNFRIKEGKHFIGRLIPPMHSLRTRTDGWKFWHTVHFGYDIVDKEGKSRVRPFECVEKKNFKTKILEVSCPECRLREKVVQNQSDREKLIADGLKDKNVFDQTKIKAAIEADPELKQIGAWLYKHNVQGRHHINVCEMGTGELGVFEIGSRHFKLLDATIKELKAKQGLDPFDLDAGCYFDFSFTGLGGSTIHKVEVMTEPGDQKGTWKTKSAPMSQSQIDEAADKLPDLTTTVRKLSKDQIQLLVDSGGEPSVVEAIMESGNGQVKLPEEDSGMEVQEEVPPPVSFKPPSMRQDPTPPAPVQVSAPAEESELEKMRKLLAEMEKKVAAASAAPATVSETVVPLQVKSEGVIPLQVKGVPKDFDPNIPAADFAKKWAPPGARK